MKHSVRRIGLRILTNASAREGTIADIHRKEQIVHRLLSIDRQDHVLRLMLDNCGDEAEEIIDVV